MTRLALLSVALCASLSCGRDVTAPATALMLGNWGGSQTGAIVTDSIAHIHVGCTYGDVIGRIPLDRDGQFSVSGSYLIRAFPIAVGPTHPALFTGDVNGTRLTLTITVTDTVEHKTHVLGPVTMRFGKIAQMGPCPICMMPGQRAR